MELSKREQQLWEELHEWRQSFYNYQPTDLENSYDKWVEHAFSLLPEQIQTQFFDKLDNYLFHLNSLLRGTKLQTEARERILQTARSMNEDIKTLTDMKKLPIDQLIFIADQQAAKHRLYSLFQGGMSGSGRTVAITSDFIAMLVINLRAVQLTAMAFGHELQSPAELLETLKVLTVSTMPDRVKMVGWEELMIDLRKDDHQFYYDKPERILDQSCLDETLVQLLKIGMIVMFSRQKLSGFPVISMAIGAGVNYQTTRKVTRFALNYYQFKYLYEKSSGQI